MRIFEKISSEIEDMDAQKIAKSCKPLLRFRCASANSQITAQRKVHFFAFALVRAEGVDFAASREEQFMMPYRSRALKR